MNKDCVSLEVALKLQKAGYKYTEVPRSNYWYWNRLKGSNTEYFTAGYVIPMFHDDEEYIPAPTATQLAEELPSFIEGIGLTESWQAWLSIEKQRDPKWFVSYKQVNDQGENLYHSETIENDFLPDALGLMMVYLLENNLLK